MRFTVREQRERDGPGRLRCRPVVALVRSEELLASFDAS
jgi:hypothetical protein